MPKNKGYGDSRKKTCRKCGKKYTGAKCPCKY